ncbi:MAG: PP2C family protein-serine/threonine phosphatase [Marmoricola sp.]
MTTTLGVIQDSDPGDPAPSTWPPGAGLLQILEVVRFRMQTDTATVLLMNQPRTGLEPAATVGLDRTVRRAPALRLGQGFAGRVAQLRQPVIIDEVTRDNVVNPVLLNHGVTCLLGVPITVDSELLGVLHVGRRRRELFTEEDVLRLTEIAHDVGLTLRQRFVDDSHVAALALQRSLLPASPQAPPGIEIAARYVPAEGDLGGDWYDTFELPDGRLALVMGDVVGHGFEAAIVMGRLRSALRSYALEHKDPAEILTRLDAKICHFEPGCLATVLLGISSAPYEKWSFSSAGHFPPIVAALDGSGERVDLPTDRLLGVPGPGVRRTTTIEVPEGGLICLFTDGLVERRPSPEDGHRDLVAENVELLRKAVMATEDPETACIRVLAEVVGEHVGEDDIALLVARRAAPA